MRFSSKFKKKIGRFTNEAAKTETSLDDTYSLFESHGYSYQLKFVNCKYGKFIPILIGCKHHGLYNLQESFEINGSDSKRNRLKHLKILAKYILLSDFSFSSNQTHSALKLKKTLEKDIKTHLPDSFDKETMHMLKISKEFQKTVKKVLQDPDVNFSKGSRNAHLARNLPFNMNDVTYRAMSGRNISPNRVERQLCESLPETESNNNSVPSLKYQSGDDCDLNCNFCDEGKQELSYIDRSRLLKQFSCKDKKLCMDEYAETTFREKSKLLDIHGSYAFSERGEENRKMLEIHSSSRFGEVNENHCNAVMKLANQRMYGNDADFPLEVCVFIQENSNDCRELNAMRLDLIEKCLSAYFFPGKDIVTVKIQKDLKQFLTRTVFQGTTVVKDLFGRRHCIDYCLNFGAVMLVSKSISALLRHQGICLLDTMALILGIDRDNMLVLRL